MDLMKIPKEERNFEELKIKIEKMIQENVNLTSKIQSRNDDAADGFRGEGMVREISPMEKILNNPGLVHLAENIFRNLDNENIEVCALINQSSKQITDNSMFWLRKMTSLSKENQKDWVQAFKSMQEKEKAIMTQNSEKPQT